MGIALRRNTSLTIFNLDWASLVIAELDMGIQAADSHDVLSAIIKRKAVALEDVLILRRQVWPDGAVSKSEAEMLFRINDAIEEGCAEWDDFFVEAITTYLVDQAHPPGFVSDGEAAWFEHRILHDGRICTATELEVLVTVLETATHLPHRFEMLALETVRDAVLEGDRVLLNNLVLEKGVIGDPEVALLRRVLYAKGGARSDGISLDEAELLFELNDATAEGTNCTAWTTLFVNALSNYLLTQNDYIAPSRNRLREIDNWLNRPSAGVIGFDAAVARQQSKHFKSGGVFADIKSAFGGLSPMEELYELRSGERARSDAGRVDSDEARWLIQRFAADRKLTHNEQALLIFLKAGGYTVDDALEPYLAVVE